MKRRARPAAEPEALRDVLGAVVDGLGGAMVAEAGRRTGGCGAPESVLGEELAARTEVVYRSGELRVTAANPVDAGRLAFFRERLAGWAQQAYGLAEPPVVAVGVARQKRDSGRRNAGPEML